RSNAAGRAGQAGGRCSCSGCAEGRVTASAQEADGAATSAHRRRIGRHIAATVSALLSPPARAFTAQIHPISTELRARMTNKSWRDDPRCPRFEELAYIEVAHVTMDGGVAQGELVVAAPLVSRAIEVFRRLYQLGFPIRQLRLVDDYGASDDASMSA